MSKLYKYEGPVLNYNGQVRNNCWTAYVKAYSVKQALMLLCRRYKKEFTMASYVKLKGEYLNEVLYLQERN